MNEKLWEKLWTQQEFADFVRVVPATIKNWRDQGLIPYIQVPGSRRVIIPGYAVKEFINRYTINKKGGDKTRYTSKIKRKKPDISPTPSKQWRI